MASLLAPCTSKDAWTWLVSRDPCRQIPAGHSRQRSIRALRAPVQRIQPLVHMGLKLEVSMCCVLEFTVDPIHMPELVASLMSRIEHFTCSCPGFIRACVQVSGEGDRALMQLLWSSREHGEQALERAQRMISRGALCPLPSVLPELTRDNDVRDAQMGRCNARERGALRMGFAFHFCVLASYISQGGCHAATAIVALTHDPRLDDLTLLEAVRTPAFYIGAMGSRRTSEKRMERVRRIGGLDDDALDRIHAPIGLKLGSKTPAEIALAVMADIVRVSNGVSRVHL